MLQIPWTEYVCNEDVLKTIIMILLKKSETVAQSFGDISTNLVKGVYVSDGRGTLFQE